MVGQFRSDFPFHFHYYRSHKCYVTQTLAFLFLLKCHPKCLPTNNAFCLSQSSFSLDSHTFLFPANHKCQRGHKFLKNIWKRTLVFNLDTSLFNLDQREKINLKLTFLNYEMWNPYKAKICVFFEITQSNIKEYFKLYNLKCKFYISWYIKNDKKIM